MHIEYLEVKHHDIRDLYSNGSHYTYEFKKIYIYIFPGNSAVKNLLVNAGGARYTSLIPGSGR